MSTLSLDFLLPEFEIKPIPNFRHMSAKLLNRDGEANCLFDQKFHISDASLAICNFSSSRVEITFEVISHSFVVGSYYSYFEIGGRRYSQALVTGHEAFPFLVKKGTYLRIMACQSAESSPLDLN